MSNATSGVIAANVMFHVDKVSGMVMFPITYNTATEEQEKVVLDVIKSVEFLKEHAPWLLNGHVGDVTIPYSVSRPQTNNPHA